MIGLDMAATRIVGGVRRVVGRLGVSALVGGTVHLVPFKK
jgi:hypothetical protein